MHLLLKGLASLLALAIVLTGVAWAGLKVRPRPLPPFPVKTPPLERVPIPAGLPEPVARYYQVIAGDAIPVVKSVILTGTASMRIGGIRFPGTWRFTHEAGQNYRHYMEAQLFRYPIFKVNEHFLDGKARLDLPVGLIEKEPKVDSAANLGLWGESVLFPSIFVLDPRVRWEPVDAHSARLIIPAADGEDSFDVAFDPATGLIRQMVAMRYKDVASPAKTAWRCVPLEWERYHGVLVPAKYAVVWADEPDAWLIATTTDIIYNVDVASYIRSVGP